MSENTPRVLMVTFQFPPILGGAEIQAARLAKELSDRGVSVSVVTARFNGFAPFEIWNGMPVHRVWCPTDATCRTRFGVYVFVLSLAWFMIFHAREYDIVHTHVASFASALAVLIGRVLNKGTIAKPGSAGALGDFAQLEKLRGGRRMSGWIKRADRIVAITRAIRDDLVAAGVDAARVVEIPNGVDTRSFSRVGSKTEMCAKLGLAPDARIALFVGSLRAVKNVGVLLNVWHSVLKQCPNARLVIVGDGPLREELCALAEQLGVAGSVLFAGRCPDPLSFYLASDVFVLPSRDEGMSNALLEAMAVGLPCLASNVGGNREIISHGQNGLLFETENRAELAEALCLLLTDDGLAVRLGEAARQTVDRRFSFVTVADQYMTLYRHLAVSRNAKS